MIRIDNNLLVELGLDNLPTDEKNRMLALIYEQLEIRVGRALAKQMTRDQLDEFQSYVNAGDEAGALKWLETNFPSYKDVVASELELLKNEIKANADQLVAAVHADIADEKTAQTQQAAHQAVNPAGVRGAQQVQQQQVQPQPIQQPQPQNPPQSDQDQQL